MLRLKVTPGGRGEGIPAGLNTLSVSWLNGQFKAVAVHRGVVEGTWERAGDIEGAGQFEALIREAVAKTNYHGQTVSLLLAHPRLVQQLIDVPPVKGPTLQKLIRRQAQQQKLFPGEAAWAWQPSVSGKGSQRLILHLFPKPMLDALVQGCKRNGLDLISVVPVSAVVHRQLTQLPLDKDEVALLAAETGGSTTVAVGRSDGQLLLVRTLTNNWNESVERMAVDLNRTILFLSQQHGVSIQEGVSVFGAGAPEQAQALQGQLQLAVTLSPVGYEPFYWATEALKLRPDRAPNFLTHQLQRAPQRRVYARIVGAGAALVVLAAVGVSVFALRAARQEVSNIKRLHQRATQLETQRQQLQQRNAELVREQQLIKLVLEDQPSPVPMWFLGYLSELVPPGLVVTNLHLKREDDAWSLRMATISQGSITQRPPAEVAATLAQLRTQMSNGVFHVAPPGSREKEAPGHAGTGPKPAPGDPLVLEGVIR
jgi:hypothetical protein